VAGTTAYLKVWFPGDPTGSGPYSPRRSAGSPSQHSRYAFGVTAAYDSERPRMLIRLRDVE
jgi:hypothetical protein